MATASSLARNFLPAEATMPSDRQRLFVLFFTGTLIDLVVLSLFAEYSDKVYIDSFTTALLASIVLQILLKATILLEHRVLAKFKGKTGFAWKGAKYFTAWLILFGSKFVILEALSIAFEKDVHFNGVWHGIIWLIIVVVTMVIVEELVARLYRKLA
jgi:membrane protease YdiL (CAAX protease family)